MVKNLPANTGDMGSIPGSGRFHRLQDNQVHAPQPLSLGAPGQCATSREASTMRSPYPATGEEPPPATTGESPHAAINTYFFNANIFYLLFLKLEL